MNLTSVEVSAKSVKKTNQKNFDITMTLTGYNTTGEGEETIVTKLFSMDFVESYNTDQAISVIRIGFATQMQEYIDRYKAENNYLNHPQVSASVDAVQSVLTV